MIITYLIDVARVSPPPPPPPLMGTNAIPNRDLYPNDLSNRRPILSSFACDDIGNGDIAPSAPVCRDAPDTLASSSNAALRRPAFVVVVVVVVFVASRPPRPFSTSTSAMPRYSRLT